MASHAGSFKGPLSLTQQVTAPEADSHEAPARVLTAQEPASERLDLRALFELHYGSIWRLLRRLGVRHAQLDDAAQEVFWVAARRFADIQAGSEHSFLYGVALRVASQELKRQKAAEPIADLEAVPHLVDHGPTPHDELEQRQKRLLLDTVLTAMAPDLRVVFVLAEIEGLEVREIAALEEVPLGTASSRLRRAREEFSAIAKRVRATLANPGRNR